MLSGLLSAFSSAVSTIFFFELEFKTKKTKWEVFPILCVSAIKDAINNLLEYMNCFNADNNNKTFTMFLQ